MALILNIESATAVCSVALSESGQVIAQRETSEGLVHSEKLAVYIAEVLEASGYPAGSLEAVAVSIGPGSYTGLRVGLSTAKGLCYGLGIPLIGLPTLMSLARAGIRAYPGEGYQLSCIDARREEVYALLTDAQGVVVKGPVPLILDETDPALWLGHREGPIWVSGDATAKVIRHWGQGDVRPTEVVCSARHLAELAEEAFTAGEFAPIAYIEPLYLKDPNITKPTKMRLSLGK
jgi:tRNA threonylcarbamoyladenosine biosynthesis protein TsaB